MRILFTVLIVSLTALAGCSDSGPSPEIGDDEKKFEDIKLGDGLGAIRGLVLDPTITPVAGVTIALQGSDEAAISDADGAFVFVDLEPGTYFLQASKLGYESAQASAPVVAGEARPDIVKIQLVADPSTAPHVSYQAFEGLLQCSANAAVVGFNACGFAADVTGQDLGEAQVRYPIEGEPTWIQTEMVWESTQPLGGGLELYYSYGDCGSGFYCDHGGSGTSPLIVSANATLAADILSQEEGELYIRVFGAETSNVPDSGVGLTLEQRFTHYTTVFYGFMPDEGWTFVNDGPHPVPS